MAISQNTPKKYAKGISEYIDNVKSNIKRKLQKGDVDEELFDINTKFTFREVPGRLEEAKISYFNNEIDPDVSEEEVEEAFQEFAKNRDPNFESAFWNTNLLERPGSPNDPGVSIRGLKPKGRARRIEDAFEAAEYLIDQAEGEELIEAIVAYTNNGSDESVTIEHNEEGEISGGNYSDGGFDTEAERALNIIEEFEYGEEFK